MFISSRIIAINKLYQTVYPRNSISKNITEGLWQSDGHLSYKGVPNKDGYFILQFKDGLDSIPIHLDSLGFRTVEYEKQLNYDTLNLFLGCSYTFGETVKAEKTYPYITSELLKNNYINAAMLGYGMGQMKELFDSLISKHHFKYAFIQLSPWLADRAMHLKGLSLYGYSSPVYFSDKDYTFCLNYPKNTFQSYSDKIHISKNRLNKENGNRFLNKLKFSVTEGCLIEILDFFTYKKAVLKSKIGIIPRPTNKKLELEKYFYSYVIDKCIENNTIPVIVKAAYYQWNIPEPQALMQYLDHQYAGKFILVDLDSIQKKAVTTTGENFNALFGIHHISITRERIFYDPHPNEDAHNLFAHSIFEEITSHKNK